MKTTVEIPDPLFRRIEALAAARRLSVEELITRAVERELPPEEEPADDSTRPPYRVKVPLVRLGDGRKIDLTDFDFDDLLT